MKASAAIDVMLALMIQAQRVATIVQQAQAENRADLKPEEVKILLDNDDKARQLLVGSITRAKAEGR